MLFSSDAEQHTYCLLTLRHVPSEEAFRTFLLRGISSLPERLGHSSLGASCANALCIRAFQSHFLSPNWLFTHAAHEHISKNRCLCTHPVV